MRRLTYEAFFKELNEKKLNKSNLERIDMKNIVLENINLCNVDFREIDFSWSEFTDVDFAKSKFDYSILDNCVFVNVSFSGSSLVHTSLKSADLRGCDLSKSNCDGAVFSCALLEGANVSELIYTKNTVHFEISCPKEGYFIGYKKCFNSRMVTLLIPKDAKRSSSTSNACRCDKAKVIAITNTDGTGFYDEASSFVDENFIYKIGEMVHADSYNDDRWLDSSHGIHFWMSFEEALRYM